MRKIFSFLTIIFLHTLLSSHEFWLDPEKFIYDPGDDINIRFWVGENFEGVNWSGNREKVNKLQLYTHDIKDDLSESISEEKGDSLQLALFDEGTALLTFNSNNSFIELEAKKFNDYLQEDGLQEAIDYRKEHTEEDSVGREFYQRSVKTLLQVGDLKDNTFSKKTGLPIDIIPLQNPYDLQDGDSLTIKILFQQKPLFNTRIRIWQRVNTETISENYTSNEKGEIRIKITTIGKWMVSTVKMVHLTGDPKANWQSYWGSLTWGYIK